MTQLSLFEDTDAPSHSPNGLRTHEGLSEVAPDMNGMMQSIRDTLGTITVAEELIENQLQRGDGSPVAVWESFLWLQPSALVASYADRIIQPHMNELVLRVARATEPGMSPDDALAKVPDSCDAPTRAEMLAALMHASQAVPLDSKYSTICFKLFTTVMGQEAADEVGITDRMRRPRSNYVHERALDDVRSATRKETRDRILSPDRWDEKTEGIIDGIRTRERSGDPHPWTPNADCNDLSPSPAKAAV